MNKIDIKNNECYRYYHINDNIIYEAIVKFTYRNNELFFVVIKNIQNCQGISNQTFIISNEAIDLFKYFYPLTSIEKIKYL